MMAASRKKRTISERNAMILSALCHLNDAQRVALLKKADRPLIQCICKCVLNLLKGNVPIGVAQKKKLKKHAPTLRKIASTNGKFASKKRVIVQNSGGGGFITALLLPNLTTVLSKAFE